MVEVAILMMTACFAMLGACAYFLNEISIATTRAGIELMLLRSFLEKKL